MICTFPSKNYDINKYIAIKNYLLQFGKEKLEQTGKKHIINGIEVRSRKKTSNKWFETQDSIAYSDLFLEQNIVWQRITHANIFCLTDNNMVVLDSMAFISCKQLYKNWLLGFLNSNTITLFIKSITPGYGKEGFRLSNQFLELVPIPKNIDNSLDETVRDLKNNFNNDVYNLVNENVAKAYNLTKTEYDYIVENYTINT